MRRPAIAPVKSWDRRARRVSAGARDADAAWLGYEQSRKTLMVKVYNSLIYKCRWICRIIQQQSGKEVTDRKERKDGTARASPRRGC